MIRGTRGGRIGEQTRRMLCSSYGVRMGNIHGSTRIRRMRCVGEGLLGSVICWPQWSWVGMMTSSFTYSELTDGLTGTWNLTRPPQQALNLIKPEQFRSFAAARYLLGYYSSSYILVGGTCRERSQLSGSCKTPRCCSCSCTRVDDGSLLTCYLVVRNSHVLVTDNAQKGNVDSGLLALSN